MKSFAAVLIVLLATACYGQINIEDKRLARGESGFSGSINLSVELERGNSSLTEIALKPRFNFRADRSQWFMLNSYSLVETDETSVVNEGFSHLRYNFTVTGKILFEALTQVQYNREQDLRLRLLLGGGLRYELIEGNPTSLAFGATGMFEYEELDNGEILRTPRNSNYIALRITSAKKFSLQNTVYVQAAFNNIKDVRVLDNLGLSVAIAQWLALTLEIEYRYDSRPPEGVREYDLSLKNGITVSF